MLTCFAGKKPREKREFTLVVISVDRNMTDEPIDKVFENIRGFSRDEVLGLGSQRRKNNLASRRQNDVHEGPF